MPPLELAVDEAEEVHVGGAERGRRAPSAPAGGCRPARRGRRRASQVPFEPSVSTSRWTSVAGVGPLRERRAAAELDVVGVRADRERASGAARSTASSRPVSVTASRLVEQREVVGHVDVEGEVGSRTTRTASPAAGRSAAWRRNEPGPYANAKAASTGTDSTGVPSSRWHGNERDDRATRRRERSGPRDRRTRQVGVGDDDARRGPARAPRRGRRRRRRRATRVVDDRDAAARGPRTDLGCADDTTTTGSAPAAASDASAIRRRELGAVRVVERAPRGGPCRLRTPGSGSRRPRRSRDGSGPWACVCYRPWTPVVSSVARAALLAAAAARDASGRSRARSRSRARGPVILASNHVSYLDPLVARRTSPTGATARSGSSPRPSCSTSACSGRSSAARTRSRCSAAPRRGRRRSTPRSTRCGAGECVAVFPEGTISLDLEPMAGKSGTARLAAASGVPVTPVGLWGAHRILFKGRKPHWQTGRRRDRRSSATAARASRPTRTCSEATDRIMAAICDCRSPGPARSTRSGPSAGDDGWWVRAPGDRRGAAAAASRASERVVKVAVIGAGSWGTTVAALVGAQRRRPCSGPAIPSSPTRIDAEHENADYLPGDRRCPRRSLPRVAELEAACTGADVVVMGVPSHGFRDRARPTPRPRIGADVAGRQPVEGLEQGTLLRMTEVIADVLPDHRPDRIGVLTGPNLAREVAAGQPTASVVARRRRRDAAEELQRLFMTPTFRVYTNPDVVGCEIAGALKNVIAIAAGIAARPRLRRQHEGRAHHPRARRARPPRRRARRRPAHVLRPRRHGRPRRHVHERQEPQPHLGVELGQGRALDEIVAEMNMVAEGVKSTEAVLELGRRSTGSSMPIAEQVGAVLYEGRAPAEIVPALMLREAKPELRGMRVSRRCARCVGALGAPRPGRGSTRPRRDRAWSASRLDARLVDRRRRPLARPRAPSPRSASTASTARRSSRPRCGCRAATRSQRVYGIGGPGGRASSSRSRTTRRRAFIVAFTLARHRSGRCALGADGCDGSTIDGGRRCVVPRRPRAGPSAPTPLTLETSAAETAPDAASRSRPPGRASRPRSCTRSATATGLRIALAHERRRPGPVDLARPPSADAGRGRVGTRCSTTGMRVVLPDRGCRKRSTWPGAQVLLDPDPGAATTAARARGLGPRRRGGVSVAQLGLRDRCRAAQRATCPAVGPRAGTAGVGVAHVTWPAARGRCSPPSAHCWWPSRTTVGRARSRAPGGVGGPGPRGARRPDPRAARCRSRSGGTAPRPALLWEVTDPAYPSCAAPALDPTWSTTAPEGETLLEPPTAPRP